MKASVATVNEDEDFCRSTARTFPWPDLSLGRRQWGDLIDFLFCRFRGPNFGNFSGQPQSYQIRKRPPSWIPWIPLQAQALPRLRWSLLSPEFCREYLCWRRRQKEQLHTTDFEATVRPNLVTSAGKITSERLISHPDTLLDQSTPDYSLKIEGKRPDKSGDILLLLKLSGNLAAGSRHSRQSDHHGSTPLAETNRSGLSVDHTITAVISPEPRTCTHASLVHRPD